MSLSIQRAGLGLAAITGFTLFVGSISPSREEISNGLVILAPADIVWEQISLLKNQAQWVEYTTKGDYKKLFFEGTDGKYGASMLWDGKGASGEGVQRTTAIKARRQYQGKLRISKPQRTEADVNITMQSERGDKGVRVDFSLGYAPSAKSKALSIFNPEKVMSKIVIRSLKKLKKRCEQLAKVRQQYGAVVTIKEMPSTIFVGKRKRISLSDLVDNQRVGGKNVLQVLSDEGRETEYPATLYYEWNEKTGIADIVSAGEVYVPINYLDHGYQNIHLGSRRYVVAECVGNLAKIDATHRAINQFLRDNKLKSQYPIIEEHIIGPAHQVQPKLWRTRIMYPID
jgi:effector-binding domain-containing protein